MHQMRRGWYLLSSVIDISRTGILLKELLMSRLSDPDYNMIYFLLANESKINAIWILIEPWWDITQKSEYALIYIFFSCNIFNLFLDLIASILQVLTLQGKKTWETHSCCTGTEYHGFHLYTNRNWKTAFQCYNNIMDC